jgi:phosphoribosyl 1,2-cyclic phosphodiesterase
MNITLRGIRGSIPTFNPDTRVYGGNTSCIEVEEDGTLLVLDAGSGITSLNFSENLSYHRIDILLTHLHIDHIQGLGFFNPLFDPSKEVHIWGPASSSESLRGRLGRFFSPPFSPVYFRDLTCQLSVHEISNSSFEIGPFTIQSRFVIHPGPTVGYRVQTKSGVLTYIPDHEPALGRAGLQQDVKWLSGSDLASGADLLLHDAQYTMDEYRDKTGWGHSAMEDTLRFASLTEAKRLLLMHHDPMHSDAQLDMMFRQLTEHTHYSFPFEMAVEGTVIIL